MTAKDLTIITGGSRGLGHCLVQSCLEGTDVLNLSRQPAVRAASAPGHELHNLRVDFQDVGHVERALDEWFAAHPAYQVRTVIHNAAMLSLGWLTDLSHAELASTFTVNVFTPLAITAHLFRRARFATDGSRVVYVISSLARHVAGLSFAGLGAYSGTKAAISKLALVQSREFELVAPHIKVLRIHPGIVDTELQRELRSDPNLDPRFAEKTAGLPPYQEGDWVDQLPKDAMRTISAEFAAEFVLWATRSAEPSSEEYDFYHATQFHSNRS